MSAHDGPSAPVVLLARTGSANDMEFCSTWLSVTSDVKRPRYAAERLFDPC